MITLYFLFIFQCIFNLCLFGKFVEKEFGLTVNRDIREREHRDRFRDIREQRVRIRDINRLANNEEIRNPQNNIERNVENGNIQNRNGNNELNRIREMINNFDRFINFIRNIINNNQSNNDTKESENPYEVNNFIQQKTRNIIIENKQEYSIETNIKNIISNKENKIPNAINLEEINIRIANSETNEIINNNNN